MTPKEQADALAALSERLLGIIGSSYAHARKCGAGSEEADRIEGSFLRALLRRGLALHEDYIAFHEAAAPKPAPPPERNGTLPAKPLETKR